MQEIKKRRIVIASVLKPVDDVRMFEKMGQSLASQYDVHIIGYPGRNPPASPGVSFYPLTKFNRLSLERMMAPWKILRTVLALRPSMLIITSHELLVIAVLAKLLAHSRIVYDVQENYGRNILYTDAFPVLLRPFLAAWVKFREWITTPFIDHFILAETGYRRELTFPESRITVIENKLKKDHTTGTPKAQVPRPKSQIIHLLFSGTLSESTGVFTAIDLAGKLHALNPTIRLTIIGYCPLPQTLQRLRAAIASSDFIRLIGGDQLVPHPDILNAINEADYGIIAYPPNPSTANRIPTKLYEYLGNCLPILLIDHRPWVETCAPYPAAISFRPDAMDAADLLEKMSSTIFYSRLPEDVYWKNEEQKLFSIISTIN